MDWMTKIMGVDEGLSLEWGGFVLSMGGSVLTALLAELMYDLFYEERATGSNLQKSFLLLGPAITFGIGALALFGLGAVAPASFMAHFTVFVLACFVGYMVIWNVTPALHAPLMSVTNAISSIIIIGALLQISSGEKIIMWLAGSAVLITAINIAGGFAVTRRMLEMFRK